MITSNSRPTDTQAICSTANSQENHSNKTTENTIRKCLDSAPAQLSVHYKTTADRTVKKLSELSLEDFLNEISKLECASSCEEILNFIEIIKDTGNIDAKIEGDTLLHHVSRCQDKLSEIGELLVKYGADVNAQNMNGYTALHLSITSNNIEIFNLLLENNANVDIQNQFGQTALHLSITGNQTEMFNLLLSKGANVNVQTKDGNTALHFASCSKNIEIFNLLLSKGASINIKNNHRYTALHFSIYNDQIEIFHLLLKYGADLDTNTISSIQKRYQKPEYIASLNTYFQPAINKFTNVEKLLPEFKSLYAIIKDIINIDGLFEAAEQNKPLLLMIGHAGGMKSSEHIAKFKKLFGYFPEGTPLSLKECCADTTNLALQHNKEKISSLPLPATLQRYLALQVDLKTAKFS